MIPIFIQKLQIEFQDTKPEASLKTFKKIPYWWKYFVFLGTDMARMVPPCIYLPLDMYERLVFNKYSALDLSVLIHEYAHLVRSKRVGYVYWCIRYLFSKKYQLNEELIAIEAQMKYLKKHNETYDIERKARQFASIKYNYLLEYEEARRVLSRLWN